MGAVPTVFPPDERIGVGTDGLTIRRDVEPGPVASHVMMINVGLRNPIPVHDLGCIDRFDHVEKITIPVVVMADILVVQPGKTRTLILRTQGLVVPVGDHDLTVRVEAGNHEIDHVFQYPLRLLISPG